MALQNFQAKPNSYILIWPGLKPHTITWGGESLTLPPRTDVSTGEKGTPYRYPSAKLGDRWIPGTIVISDRFNQAGLKIFDALEYARGLSQNEPLVARGLEIAETPEEVAPLMAAGIPKWEEKELMGAEETIRNEIARRQAWENRGQVAPPPLSPQALKDAYDLVQVARRRDKESEIPTDALTSILKPGATPDDIVTEQAGLSDSKLYGAMSGEPREPETVTGFRPPPAETQTQPAAELDEETGEFYADESPNQAVDLFKRSKRAGVTLRKEHHEALLSNIVEGDAIDEDMLEAITERVEAQERKRATSAPAEVSEA